MKAMIVPIGNSKGIRIPKILLEQCHLKKDVELIVQDDMIIIRPEKKTPRQDWDAQFKKMKDRGEDRLLVPDKLDLDLKGWEW